MNHALHSNRSSASLSPSEMRENLGALVIAGSENVAITLSFTLYQTLKHPKAYEEARDEFRECNLLGEVTSTSPPLPN